VKSAISSEDDVVRGMFQYIKYRALIEAAQKYQLEAVNARVVLVLGKALPAKLLWAKNLFGTEIIEDVRVPASFKARDGFAK
jgi:fructose-specific component phosphotransferase system IIB-like protein